MKKPIFLRAVMYEDNVIIIPLKDQTHNVAGKETEIVTNASVTVRDFTSEFTEGEIWATNSLVMKKQNYYVAGAELYQITDEMGIVKTKNDCKDDQHWMWCQNYNDYTQGRPMRSAGDFGMPDKPKRKRKSLLDRIKADSDLKPLTIEDDGWYVDKDLWYYLVRAYKKKKNVLMVGSSGAGKTDLIRLMMPKLKKNLSVFDMAISNPNKALCGNLRADNGSTYYQLARFAKNIQDEGLILLDELSRAAPTANNILLPVLDGRRTLYIEDAINEADRQIKVHDNCCFWATANIGAEFVGTSTLDHALLNRFLQVPVTYPPRDKESLLLQKVHKLDSFMADTIVKAVHDIRNHTDLSSAKDISTRQLMDIAELVSDGYKPLDAFKWSILNQFESNEHDGGERATVMTLLQSM